MIRSLLSSALSKPQILMSCNGMTTISLMPTPTSMSLLQQYTDKEWSLVDAASFVVMRQLGISEAFTSDHHFSQAGFIQRPR